MSKLILSLALTFLFSSANAQGIEFFGGSYQDAFQKAGADDKLVFVDAYAVWCGPCKRMSKQVFPKTEAGNFFNSNFVNIKIDMEKGQGLEFGKTYPVSAYPTFFFINGEGEIVYRFTGGRDVDGLIAEAKKALSRFDNSEKYIKLYAEGDRTYATVFKLIKALNNHQESSSISEYSSLKIANEYIKDQKDLSTEENIRLLFEATTEVDSKLFEHLISYKKQAVKLFGREAFNDKVVLSAKNTLIKSIQFDAPSLAEEADNAVKKYAKEEYKKYVLESELLKANRANDSEAFVKSASKYHRQIIKGEEKEEISLIEKLLKAYDNDPKALNLASDIAVNVALNNTNASNCLLACHTFIRLQNWNEARKWAEKAEQVAGTDRSAKYQAQQQIKFLESK